MKKTIIATLAAAAMLAGCGQSVQDKYREDMQESFDQESEQSQAEACDTFRMFGAEFITALARAGLEEEGKAYEEPLAVETVEEFVEDNCG